MPQIDPLQTDLPQVHLHPGELFVAQEPTLITTILGSCVSVCLYCPVSKAGAMCHGVMPAQQEHDADSFRFVDTSVSYMVEVMARQRHFSCAKLEAKLFGGADVLSSLMNGEFSSPSIGSQNILAAKAALKKHGVPIVNEHVGGDRGCKLFFYTHTGEVYLKFISRSSGAP
ncbi:MAG: chemotaxis protein CheD [Thermodesulfobacteriota bacterium]